MVLDLDSWKNSKLNLYSHNMANKSQVLNQSSLTTETNYEDDTWLNLCTMNCQIRRGIVFYLYTSMLAKKKAIPTKK